MSEHSCLVVEDSPMMRQLLVFALARIKKLKVTEAEDGVDGLRKLAGGKFDLVITDINMPGGDGVVLARRIRSRSKVPILAVSGLEAQAIQAGGRV